MRAQGWHNGPLESYALRPLQNVPNAPPPLQHPPPHTHSPAQRSNNIDVSLTGLVQPCIGLKAPAGLTHTGLPWGCQHLRSSAQRCIAVASTGTSAHGAA